MPKSLSKSNKRYLWW